MADSIRESDFRAACDEAWSATRPLPEPPRTTRLAKSLRGDDGRSGGQLEDWLSELTVGNTLDAD